MTDRHGRAVEQHLAAGHAADAEQRLGQFGAARADQPGHADDLAAADLERDRPGRAASEGDVAHRQANRGRRRGGMAARVELLQVAADHEPDHRIVADLLPAQSAGVAAVAQHDDAVGDAPHLGQPVRDVDHGHAGALQVGDDLEEPFRLRLRQAGRRLVHDDEPGRQRQRPGDFDQLPLAGRQVADAPGRRHVQADAAQQTARRLVHGRLVEPAQPAAADALAAEEKVGGHAQVLGQVQLLVDEHDAPAQGVGHAVGRHRPAVHEQLAAVGDVDAGQDLHQRRFAGAVLADEGQHLAGRDVQRHAVQRLHAGEVLADVADFEERGHVG